MKKWIWAIILVSVYLKKLFNRLFIFRWRKCNHNNLRKENLSAPKFSKISDNFRTLLKTQTNSNQSHTANISTTKNTTFNCSIVHTKVLTDVHTVFTSFNNSSFDCRTILWLVLSWAEGQNTKILKAGKCPRFYLFLVLRAKLKIHGKDKYNKVHIWQILVQIIRLILFKLINEYKVRFKPTKWQDSSGNGIIFR